MSTINVAAIADLARLHLTPEEEQKLSEQFVGIIEYVDVIQNANINLPTDQHTALPESTYLREDVVGESLPTTVALQNAPKANEAFFKVPKVL